jgi:hypothetical protein
VHQGLVELAPGPGGSEQHPVRCELRLVEGLEERDLGMRRWHVVSRSETHAPFGLRVSTDERIPIVFDEVDGRFALPLVPMGGDPSHLECVAELTVGQLVEVEGAFESVGEAGTRSLRLSRLRTFVDVPSGDPTRILTRIALSILRAAAFLSLIAALWAFLLWIVSAVAVTCFTLFYTRSRYARDREREIRGVGRVLHAIANGLGFLLVEPMPPTPLPFYSCCKQFRFGLDVAAPGAPQGGSRS